MRLIDTDALLTEIDEEIEFGDETDETDRLINKGLKIARKDIKKQPTIDAEPVKHGHWINKGIIKNYPKQDVDKYYLLICSECGCMYRARKHESGGFINADFCPKCGAKMDGEVK